MSYPEEKINIKKKKNLMKNRRRTVKYISNSVSLTLGPNLSDLILWLKEAMMTFSCSLLNNQKNGEGLLQGNKKKERLSQKKTYNEHVSCLSMVFTY